MCAWWADGRQANGGMDARRSTICGMAVAAAAVVTTGGDAWVSLSGGANCGRLPGQGRAGQGREWEECWLAQGREREGVRAHHEARRFATPKRLLDSSTRITIIGGHWLPAVITILLALARDATPSWLD